MPSPSAYASARTNSSRFSLFTFPASAALVTLAALFTLAAFAACTNPSPPPPPPATNARLLPAPPTGDVAALVSATRRDHPQLLVYVGAPWCEPCVAFHAAVAAGQLDSSFPGVTFLEFDADRDRDRLAAAGYTSEFIPLFARPAADGRASGQFTQGARKGSDWLADITPRLRALLSP